MSKINTKAFVFILLTFCFLILSTGILAWMNIPVKSASLGAVWNGTDGKTAKVSIMHKYSLCDIISRIYVIPISII